ncbi:HMG-box domain-containing protein [Aspergillus melleus]|uniref:HMG-box domain-containing protein n=1 Tax=Aspergillus melleus TaxID=138277 RepID=UPI001E8E5DFD|nr:uncharacterized protein LDX57_003571 [Aspergillus melleus]KAH8425827.1 hypothetical protein LDX57_003571 [Aspergillus melleus]
MPLNIARGGGGALRGLYLNAVSRPFRVAISQPHVRRVCLATHRGPLKPIARSVPSGILSRQLVNTYATASEATTKKKATKTTKTTEAKKATKATSEKKKKTTPKKSPGRPKVVLTEKQMEAKKLRELKKQIRELKEIALDPPKNTKPSYWNVAVVDMLPEASKTQKGQDNIFTEAVELAKKISPADKERYAAIAQSKREEAQANYEKWVRSYTPAQIREANNARRRLTKLKGRRYALIEDDRLVKPPRTSFACYVKERTQSGDFKHMGGPELLRQLVVEWKELSDSEKERYVKLREAEQERYVRECKEAYGEVSTK